MTTLTDYRQLKNVMKKAPSATDNGIVRFNGTTGTDVQDSLATVSDLGYLGTIALALSPIITPVVNPVSGLFIYTKVDNLIYKLDSTGLETAIGSSSALSEFTKFVGGTGGYASLALALAGAVDGDSILVTIPTTLDSGLTSGLNNINITFMPNASLTTPTYQVRFNGNNVSIMGLNLIVTGTVVDALKFEGTDVYCEDIFINVTTGTVTNAFSLLAASARTWINASVSGTITNKIVDAGTDNDYTIRG